MSGASPPLLSARALVKRYPVRRGLLQRTVGHVHAVAGVDLDLHPGEALGLVGESGCGKTTTGRCLLRLEEPTAGTILHRGEDITLLSQGALRRRRAKLQMIFQDPYGSLNPRRTVGQALVEPMLVHGLARGAAARERAASLLERVGLEADHLDRYPHEFSGGQRQRIGISRALAVAPEVIVCDEPVSALDVSVQAQVVNLLQDLQEELGLALLFIAHDLAVVAHLCHRVAVMYLGEVVEEAPVERLFERPLHPYTRMLLSAVPAAEPGQRRQRQLPAGEPPSPLEPSSPQRYQKRFPEAAEAFRGPLALHEVAPGHRVRCANPAPLEERAASEPRPWA